MPSELTPNLNKLKLDINNNYRVHLVETNGITSVKITTFLADHLMLKVSEITGLYSQNLGVDVRTIEGKLYVIAPMPILRCLIEDLYVAEIAPMFYSEESHGVSIGQTLMTNKTRLLIRRTLNETSLFHVNNWQSLDADEWKASRKIK